MSSTDEKGHAMLELALALPILCIVAFASLEISRSIKHAQFSAVMSREVSSIAYRECIVDIDDAQTENCLSVRRNRVFQFANRLFPGTEIIVSKYNCEPNAGRTACTSLRQEARVGVNGSFNSRYTVVNNSLDGGPLDALLARQKDVVIAEAYVPFRSVIPGITSIFSYAPEGFYDATIM